MAHQHLALDDANGLQGHADHNQNGSTTDCQAAQTLNVAQDQRQTSDECQEDGTHHGDLAQHLLDEVAGGLTGAEAGDKATVALEVVGNFI